MPAPNGVPLVEVSVRVDHARQQMTQAILDHENKIGQYIADELERKLTPEYLQKVLEKEMESVIPQAVDRALISMVNDVFWEDELRQQLAKEVGRFVKKAIRTMGFGHPLPKRKRLSATISRIYNKAKARLGW